MQSSFGQTIKKWRRLNHINQHKLAAKLGVTQQAVSAWERGIDEPSQKIKKKFQDLMNKNSALFIEKLFIKDQSTIRALVDTDGAKLILGFTHEVQRGLGTRKYLERCFVSEAFAWSSIE